MFSKNSFFFLLLITILHFSFPPALTYDTGHYHSYLAILDGQVPWMNWDIVRGPIFPLILKFTHKLFGYNSQGALILTFLAMLILIFTIVKFLQNLFPKYNSQPVFILIFTLIISDPLINGYYHTLLTEFVGATILVFSCLMAWEWDKTSFFNNSRTKFIVLSTYFFLFVPISWHLKQPYVSTALFPLIIQTIISIVKSPIKKNVFQRLLVTVASFAILFTSIICWNKFLPNEGLSAVKTRSSEGLLSSALSTFVSESRKNNTNWTSFIIENYLINTNIYTWSEYYRNDPTGHVNKKISFNRTFENGWIAYSIYDPKDNLLIPSEYPFENLITAYRQNNNTTVLKTIMKSLTAKSNFLFSILILFAPIVFIIELIFFLKNKNKTGHLHQFTLLISSTSFLHVLVYALTYSSCDRYAFPAYVNMTLLLTALIYATFTKQYPRNQQKLRSP